MKNLMQSKREVEMYYKDIFELIAKKAVFENFLPVKKGMFKFLNELEMLQTFAMKFQTMEVCKC